MRLLVDVRLLTSMHVHLSSPDLTDAVTIVLFNVLRAFSNRPFDTSLSDDQRIIPFTDVSQYTIIIIVVLLLRSMLTICKSLV